jgi:hypothetical protein
MYAVKIKKKGKTKNTTSSEQFQNPFEKPP